jgi:hypothetical protein
MYRKTRRVTAFMRAQQTSVGKDLRTGTRRVHA